MIAKAGSGGVKAKMRVGGGKRRLLASAGGAALALACALPSAAQADTYTVNSEAELQAALTAAAGNPDPSTTIVLGSSFSVSTTTFTLPNKPVTIDTQGFVLTGPNNGQGMLVAGPAGTNTLTLAGNFGGNAGVTAGTLSLTSTGTTTSSATIRGSSVSNAGQAPGIALRLNGTGTFVNDGTITAGDSVSFANNSTGNNPDGTAISILSGGTLINNNLIQGSNGQSGSDGFAVYSNNINNPSFIVNTGTIRGGSNSDPAFTGGAAIRGVGSQLLTVTNEGTIEGGNGAAAIQSFDQAWSVLVINKGTIRPGAGSTDAIRMDTNGGTRLYLELWSTSNIEGNVTASVSPGADILRFGGPDDASFDISQVSPTGKYRNFDLFEKTGASTWTLTGSHTDAMPWTIQQGTLLVGDGGASNMAFASVVDNGILVFNSSAAIAVNNIISGTGSIVQSGSGTTSLAGFSNSYSGGTTITGGKLSISSNGALGNVAGALTIDGGTLQWTGASGSLARPINWGASGGSFEVTTAGSNLTLGPLLGGGALVKSGPGVLTLAGDNTYTGGTTIASGTLNIGNGGTTGSVLGDIVDNSTVAFNRTDAYTYTGSITGTGGVSKTNTGTLTLTGHNNYGSGTTMSGGQLLIAGGGTTISGGATSINVSTAVPVMLGVDGASSAYSTTAISGATITLNRTITVSVTNGGHLTTTAGDISLRALTVNDASTNAAQLVVDGAGSRADVAGGLVLGNTTTSNGKLTISGGGALNTAGASTIGVAAGNIRGVPTAKITGAGSNWTSTGALVMSNGTFTLDQGGTASFSSATFGTATLPATLIVSGAGSSLTTTTGDLVIGSGTGAGELTVSGGGAVNVAGSLVLADSGTATGILSIGGAEGQAAAAAGAFTAPSLSFGSATSRLNFNHTDTDYIFGAAISGGSAINQVAGDTNLTGASTAFTGTTTVSGGKLRVNGALGDATSVVNVLSGGTLGGAGTIGGNVFITDGVLAPGNSPGTLTIAGNLSLTGASLLDYEFGRSDVVGGPLNDLTVVGGNLDLAGTINVTVTPGGNFDVGLYRVISYGGALTDNGLTVGSVLAGSLVQSQTSVLGQVNLVNIAGADVNFWDGGGAAGDNIVSGGTGTWQNAGGNSNWTLVDGSLNTPYPNDAFAIFAAAPGTVTVDDSLGAVTASGMQFASDGYVVSGDAIALTGSQSVIRVGDGTADGANYTATIASDLTADSAFAKTDLGTLVLTGTDHFLDGMQVAAGTLKVANGGVVDITATTNFLAEIDGNLIVTGPGSLFTTDVDMVTTRSSNSASILVNDQGQLTAGRIFLGDSPGAPAPSVIDLTVDGTGSIVTATRGLTAGRSPGTVSINVTNGGHLISDGSSFGEDSPSTVASAIDVTVDGTGSTIDSGSSFNLGAATGGTSSLTISNGGVLKTNAGGTGSIGTGGTSIAVVTGAGSQLLTDGLNVGLASSAGTGSGQLTVQAGGVVKGNPGSYAQIGLGGNGGVLVTGAGSQLQSDDLYIGLAVGGAVGQGQLTIQDGGLVTASMVRMGYNDGTASGSMGTLSLLGTPGSRGVLETGGFSRGYDNASITIDGGVLRATADNADFIENLGADALSVTLGANGGFIDSNGHDITIAPSLVGAGALTKDGAGTLTLTGANTYIGGTTINAGILQLGDGGIAGSIVGDVVDNGGLAFNRSDVVSLTGTISGTGSVSQAGSGTTILTGANSYAGTTDVTAGTLLINGDQSASTGLTTVAAAATLGGAGIIGGSVDMSAGGTLAAGSNGVGTLTINGNLTLAGTSQLNMEFGQPNAVGGTRNDLVDVGGNLTLDGTLNVSVAPGGAFDIGIYRVANYGGTLTDNGLALGTLPTGANVFVQTSVANQVNLINTGAATLSFWDGAAGPQFNNAVNGGNGIWQAGAGNSNWADASGAVNAGYSDGAFAVFSGTPGTVTIDDSLGAVTASGMQFAANGYTITGDALTLTGPQSTIRVGDGTTAGAAYTATIVAELTGTAQLVKTDLGTLVLTGANSYTGGTAINGGTVRIASDANLGAASSGLSFNGGALETTSDIASARAVALAGAGTLLTGAGTTLTLNGAVSGAGSLTKSGGGTLILTGSGSHTGGTTVAAGMLLVNGNFSGATGATSVAAGATLGGSGILGGSVTLADGAVLAPGANAPGTLTINGNLALGAGTHLAFELGEAGVVGGAHNDLVTVGGNLVLDGILDVTVPAGGAFDVGVYRLFNYGGTLTNNGLALGVLPAGSTDTIQTAVAGQVNLINTAGLTLNFWDGAAGPKNNGAINGGAGIWQASPGNDNWTDSNGTVNAGYANGGFAIFGGTGGAVTVDNSLGDVTASGLQFASTGYAIGGNGIALTNAQSVIRVGDGTAAGAGFTATVNAALSGATQLVKTDLGTLVLGGTNSYTGGTLVNGGTLQISADANLGAAAGNVTLDGGTLATSANLTSARDIVAAGAATISTASGTTFTLSGVLSGPGALTKTGAGTLLLTGDSGGYTRGTTIAGGTLAVNGVLGGPMTVGAAARLEGSGQVGSVANGGIVAPGGDTLGTLTIAGNYAGNGGTLEISAALGGDASPSARLVVDGGTSGATEIVVINRNGLGAQTVQGIKIVDVAGASDGAFTLRGDYQFDGSPAVIAGAYGYRLYKGGVTTPADGDWYLRSALLAGTGPQVPLYQPGVPVYEAYGQTLLTLNDLGTMQERIGNRQWARSDDGKALGIWGRMQASRSRPNAVLSTSLADTNVDSTKFELGADQVISTRNDGAKLVLGIVGGYGEARASIRSPYGNGSIKTQGYSAGATLSWFGPQGFYVDTRAQLTWFDSDLKSTVLGKLADGNNGMGQAYSFEIGKRAPVSDSLSITPQMQMVYSTVGFDRFTDPNGATVSSRLGDSLKSRWGISVDRQDARSHLYGVANLSYEWLDGTVTDVSGTPISRANHRLWGEFGLGGSVLLGERLTLYSEGSADTAINDFGKSYGLKGVAGLRLAF